MSALRAFLALGGPPAVRDPSATGAEPADRVFDGQFGLLLSKNETANATRERRAEDAPAAGPSSGRADADKRGKPRGAAAAHLAHATRRDRPDDAADEPAGDDAAVVLRPTLVALFLPSPFASIAASEPERGATERPLTYAPRVRALAVAAPAAPGDVGTPSVGPSPSAVSSTTALAAPADASPAAAAPGTPPATSAPAPMSAPVAAFLAQVERDPSLRAALTGGEARLTLRISGAELIVHIQVRAQRTDVRLSGTPAAALEDRASELHAALVARGLSLGIIAIERTPGAHEASFAAGQPASDESERSERHDDERQPRARGRRVHFTA